MIRQRLAQKTEPTAFALARVPYGRLKMNVA